MLVDERRRTARVTRTIELVLLCVLLAVLAGIGLAAVGRARKLSTVQTCKGDVQQLRLSAASVMLHTGPPGDVNESTDPNPLVAGAVDGDGATMKSWPRSDRFALRWKGDAQRVAVYDARSGRLVGLGIDACSKL